jgi:hypothetical protein
MGSSATSSDQVRSDIQTAFRNEPTLTSSNVSVNVTDDSIELNGTAPSAKDRDEAKRIAQSFAGNRRVVDNIKVGGSGGPDQSSSGNIGAAPDNSSTTGTNPSSTPSTATPNSGSSTSPNPETPSVPKK